MIPRLGCQPVVTTERIVTSCWAVQWVRSPRHCGFAHAILRRHPTMSGTIKHTLTLLAALLLAPLIARAAVHHIHPGENPQSVLDTAAPGDKLVFLPGLHQHGVGKHRAILYVDKPIHIELMAGATLKLADGACLQEKVGKSPPTRMQARSSTIWRSPGSLI